MNKPAISQVVRFWREGKNIGVREAARIIGISHSTLSRIERGLKYDAETLIKVQRWLFWEEK